MYGSLPGVPLIVRLHPSFFLLPKMIIVWPLTLKLEWQGMILIKQEFFLVLFYYYVIPDNVQKIPLPIWLGEVSNIDG